MPRGRRKYQPLAAYLAGLPSDVSDVTLTLAEIEAILGEPLPAGAVTDAWWGIASSPQGRGWLDAGWWVRRRAPRSPAATITFGRVDPAMPRPGPPKYEPLRAYLAAQPPDVTEVTLTFPELEAVLGSPLPATARRVTFWGNTRWRDAQSRAWRAAGWRVTGRALLADPPAVTFARATEPSG